MASDVPAWLQAMIDSGAGASDGLRWYSSEERAAAAAKHSDSFDAGRLWMSDEMRQAADEGWRHKLRVGEGPPIYFDHAGSYRLELWLDVQRTESLWVGMQGAPPFLWLPAGRDADSLRRAVRPSLPADLAQPRPHLNPLALIRQQRQAVLGPIPGPSEGQSGRVRLMAGIALAQTDQDLAQIENHLMTCRFCDPRFLLQGTAQGNPNSNPTTTVVRTLYSRSTVRLDWYDSLAGTLFADVHYAPAAQQDVIRAVNERFDLHYPLDVPADVPALLLGLEAISVPRLQAHVANRLDDPPRLQFYLYCLAILTNPDVTEVLRPYASHPSPLVRGTVIDLAGQKSPELLRLMHETETDPELRQRIEAARQGD
jgi:hypothetical protein